ncbi:MAG: hypothetical protein DRO40_01030 [Thermoprotei archaeon]|nr:MAG: hypothetical protein DRO40_01030 [Thermoprotei archaeon]
MRYKIPILLTGIIVLSLIVPVMASNINTITLGSASSSTVYLNEEAFDKALKLVYIVGNESYPLLSWAIDKNSSIAERILNKAQSHIETAVELKDDDTRMCVAYLIMALMTYSKSPIVGYEVLFKSVKTSLEENRNITSETITMIQDLSEELRSILLDVRDYALENNISLPIAIELLIARGDEYLENSQKYLEEGQNRLALLNAIQGYRHYVRAYSELIKSTISSVLKTRFRSFAEVQERLGLQLRLRFKERLEELIEHLPSRARERIRHAFVNVSDYNELLSRIKAYSRMQKSKAFSEVEEEVCRILCKKISERMRNNPMIAHRITNRMGNNWCSIIEGIVREKIKEIQEREGTMSYLIKEVINHIKNRYGVEVLSDEDIHIQIRMRHRYHR